MCDKSREFESIKARPWPKITCGTSSDATIAFRDLGEEHVARISERPIAWYLDAMRRIAGRIEDREPDAVRDLSIHLQMAAYDLYVRLVAGLMKEECGNNSTRKD